MRLGRAFNPATTSWAKDASAGSVAWWRRAAGRAGAIPMLRTRCAQPTNGSFHIIQKTQPAELPARRGIEEIAVARAGVAERRRMRTAAQHHLIDHEFAVVFAEGAERRAISGVGEVRAARPLPGCSESIVEK